MTASSCPAVVTVEYGTLVVRQAPTWECVTCIAEAHSDGKKTSSKCYARPAKAG